MQDLLDSNEIEAKGTQQEIIKAKSAFVRDALEEHMKVLHKAALLRETFRNNTWSRQGCEDTMILTNNELIYNAIYI